ncbi:Protein of unknown function [Pseudomonas agarici]|nr:Protein of unknown function [Pseudomonas agarici]
MHNIYRAAAYLLTLWTLAGCGTGSTLLRGDDAVSKSLAGYRTYCQAIPRMYSGVVYDFCVMHGEPTAQWQPDGSPVGNFPLIVLDILVSGVVDTVVLPYTINQQVREGSMVIRR